MVEQLSKRLADLRQEFVRGQEQVAQLNAARDELHAQMLRISGAIQVLEEELGRSEAEQEKKPAPAMKVA